jgi:HEAT repeat protein
MALGYASAHTSVDAAVRARLAAHPDMLYNHILDTARWLAYTGQQFVEWRGNVMKQLGGLFIAPAQFTLMRERAAAATAGTRDKGTAILFQRGLKSNDPQVRRLSALMLGYFRDEASIEHLAVLTTDEHPDVSLGAAVGLSGVRTEDAYEEMAVAITSGPEPVRQVIAEAFAAIPEPGYPTLYEAASDEDLLLRRYAIFGLRRVNTPWALLTVYRAFLEEKQFYVKSAAQQAFLDMQNNVVAKALRHYPEPVSISWLQEMGGTDPRALENPELVLVDGLTQGGPNVQSLAATAMGQLGMTGRVGDLYQALLYRDQPVRDAAHRALAEIQVQMGESLPAPT